jgi:hypothetical protein
MQQATDIAMQGIKARESAAMGPELGGRLPGLIREQQEQSGSLAFHPTFQHGQGAGGFFHNLGQALLTLGAATTPGQAIQAQVYSKPRQEYAGRAEEISNLQKQQHLTQETEPALAQVPYRQRMVEIGQQKADTQQEAVEVRAQRVADQHSNDLVRQSQGWGRLSLAQQKQQFQQWYQKTLTDIARERINAGMSMNDARVAATKEVAASLQSNKMIQESPIKTQIMDWLGVAPDIQVPEGATTQTTKPGKKIPTAPSKPEASPAAQGAPKVGEVRKGYRFKGGNPANQASWEKVGP